MVKLIMRHKLKTDIFISAIRNRQNLQFLFGLHRVNIEPYYIAKNKLGKKVIYGRVRNSNEIKKFEYDKIANIKIVDSSRFSPRIPLNSFAS